MSVKIITGDCRESLRTLPDKSVHCCVTSPPYFGLRDYGMAAQIWLEQTPDAFVAELVAVFREVWRVLRDDGTLWLNIGDSYNNYRPGNHSDDRAHSFGGDRTDEKKRGMPDNPSQSKRGRRIDGVKEKDLIGIPWMLAFALRADGWYLRQDIIWHKPNPMPESVTDRCTKAHEYVFLLSKSDRYYYDQDAIKEPLAESSIVRLQQDIEGQEGSARVPGKTNGKMKAVRFGGSKYGDDATESTRTKSGNEWDNASGMRNRRSVWTVPTQPYSEAHFATFPPALIEPCITAGCPKGGTVLDPFGGAGTTGLVADRLGRNAVLVELNPEYVRIAERRIKGDAGMFADVAA